MPDMTRRFPILFTHADRGPFTRWLNRCNKLGAAKTMTDAVRLAIRLAQAQTDETITRESGKCTSSSG